MSNQLMMFEGHHEVMILTKEDVNFQFNGDFLICGKDVANVLEYGRTEEVTKFCKEGQVFIVKNSQISDTALNRIRKLNNAGEAFITNLALNRVLGKSEKPKAEPFQDWLYEDMLPSVQKTGSYSVTDQQMDVSLLSPEMQMFKHMFDGVAKIQLEAANTKQKLDAVETTIFTIQETLLKRDDDWRKSINSMLNGAAFRMGGKYPDFRSESYRALEERGHCDLNRRLRNMKDRLAEGGATKTKIEGVSRMDVIESDAKLKEIYTMIVKEISIGSLKIAK